MDNYQCHIWIDNKTSELLVLGEHTASWGEFREGPLDQIPRMSTTGARAWRATGTKNLPGGCEGTVRYQIGEQPGRDVRIHFNIPATPFTSNTLEVDVPTGFEWRQTGWDSGGSTGSATIVLTRKPD